MSLFFQVGTTARTKIYKKLLAEHRHLTDDHKMVQADLQLAKGNVLVTNRGTILLTEVESLLFDHCAPSRLADGAKKHIGDLKKRVDELEGRPHSFAEVHLG